MSAPSASNNTHTQNASHTYYYIVETRFIASPMAEPARLRLLMPRVAADSSRLPFIASPMAKPARLRLPSQRPYVALAVRAGITHIATRAHCHPRAHCKYASRTANTRRAHLYYIYYKPVFCQNTDKQHVIIFNKLPRQSIMGYYPPPKTQKNGIYPPF